MVVIGLSGGIGSGKTVASDHFLKLGVSVVDTDVIAREVVEPGQPALRSLVEEFGKSILLENGQLDRAALREIAFSSQENKARLDSITHPAIRHETAHQIKHCDSPYCLVVVPLLSADSPFIKIMRRVLVVIADRETKISRVMKRSNLERDEVLRIMASQLTDEQRMEFADDIIENNSSLEHVYREVEQLHSSYLALSEQKN